MAKHDPEAKTAPAVPDSNSSPANATAWDGGIEFAARSDIGLRRTNNQDSLTAAPASSEEGWRHRGHLFMVADGMGAHAAGELASKLAVDAVPLSYDKLLGDGPAVALRRAIEDANDKIHSRGEANAEFHGMGTTASALTLVPAGAVVAHVGDSRVYRLRGHRLEQLSFDHSLVWEMMAGGKLREEEVPSFIPKNVITRSLGPNAEVQVDLEGPFPIRAGDRFLLCSDGLTGQVKDRELGAVLGALPPDEAAQALIDLANLRGGPDNITVIALRVKGPPLARPEGDGAASVGSPGRGPRVHPVLGAAIVLVALAIDAWLIQMAMPILALIATVSTLGLMGWLWWSNSRPVAPGSDESTPNTFGGGPYRATDCTPSPDLVADLAKLTHQLRDVAREESWQVDWDRYDELGKAATRASAEGDLPTALGQYCRTISFLMHEARRQGRSVE